MNQPNPVPRRRGRRRSGDAGAGLETRKPDYRTLRNPFKLQGIFSDDHVAAIHDTALRVLEELGIKVLLPQARKLYAAAGARVDEDTQMVFIGRDSVGEALRTAPKSVAMRAGAPERNVVLEPGALTFVPGSGCPHITDIERGRRPGTLADYEDVIRLTQGYDVFHLLGGAPEPQDIEIQFRHYAFMRAQLVLSDKIPNLYARSSEQTADSFEMIRLARGLSEEEFHAGCHTYTIINSNSPRQLDIPMAQGLIDFARANQLSVMTPFCLSGAMAPITVAGALTLQHAEALAGITLAQIARPGAPLLYGSFSSNVDMKSGAPAFGTPEHFNATLGAGQLARHIGLPWRAGGGSASNTADAQGANESQLALWGSVLAGANFLLHAAGWLEGGLTISMEKFITDVEVLQSVAELCAATPADAAAIGFDAIAEVEPGGHFFAAAHTMSRYRTAFYEPVVADLSNFGTWTESGGKSSTMRAHEVWKRRLAEFVPPELDVAKIEAIDAFVAKRTEDGGAFPL